MPENKCIGCDTPIPSGATKCPMCGAPHNSQKQQTTAQIKNCGVCGAAVYDGENRCPMCGAMAVSPQSKIEPKIKVKQEPQIEALTDTRPRKICKYCSMSIPATAAICPHCRKKLTTGFITKAVAVFLGLMFVVGIIGNMADKTPQSPSTPSPDQTKTEKERIDKQTRAVAGVLIMKKIVPDPDRLKINSAILTAKGDACYEFRFPNASGGISIQKAVLPANGDRLIIPLDDEFRKNWNSRCAGKPGEDIVDYLERL